MNLSLTPRVSASGDITMEMAAEFSILGATSNVGSEQNLINVPTFSTRNVNGVMRLRDGETGLIGGLLQNNEATSFAGSLGMNSIPILGSLFGAREKKNDSSEVIISITPHIVRAPKVTEEDLVSLRVGTQEVPGWRVRGRPSSERTRVAARRALRRRAPASGAAPGARPAPAAAAGAAPEPGRPRRLASAPLAPHPADPPGRVAGGSAPPSVSRAARPSAPGRRVLDSSRRTAGDGALQPAGGGAARGPDERSGPGAGGAKDVQSIELTIAWDPALAEVTDVAAGSLLTLDGSAVSAERALENGRARVASRGPRARPAPGRWWR